jgi:quercetin dioxygenase-like cupin family protein
MQVSLNPAARDLKKVNGDERYTPYQKAFPVDAVSELVWPNVLGGEERDWVPQSEGVHFKPLCFNVTHGYFVNLLRVRKSGVLSRHYHTNPVHAYVLKGRWYYLEHDWVAEEGSYAMEPPGETHTLPALTSTSIPKVSLLDTKTCLRRSTRPASITRKSVLAPNILKNSSVKKLMK